jgi:hypothetical protein
VLESIGGSVSTALHVAALVQCLRRDSPEIVDASAETKERTLRVPGDGQTSIVGETRCGKIDGVPVTENRLDDLRCEEA